MFDHDRSASRGEMASRRLIIFKHNDKYGNAHAHELFDRVQVELKDKSKPPRNFDDYEVTLDESNLNGVSIDKERSF